MDQKIDVTPNSGNVFADLGLPNPEVELAAADARIAAMPPEDDGWEWAVVEIMGHRQHAGRTREVERFGAKLIRVDVPIKGDPVANGWKTHFYSGASLFSFTPAEEAACLRLNKPYEPPARMGLPKPEAREEDPEQEDDGIPF